MIWFQSQMDRIIKSKDDEIERLRKDLAIQTSRANNAEDRLLTRENIQGIAPEIMPALSRVEERDKSVIRAIMAATRVGHDVEEDKDAI